MAKRIHENGGTTLHARVRKLLLDSASSRARKRRMTHFERTLRPGPGTRILDLGGAPRMWRHVGTPLHITILNLEAQPLGATRPAQHHFEIVAGDATATEFADLSFDIVFSNSVIEHVGDADRRRHFAAEARRLAPRYYVQTPCPSFPLEAHSMLPFWWHYPPSLRQRIIGHWRKSRPYFADFLEGTAPVSRGEMECLFPDGEVHVERVAVLAKSLTMVRL